MKRTLAPLVALFALAALPLPAEEPVDLSMMTRIRDEGLHHSQVMETLYQLTDVIGPRLTGSPQLKAANDWTRDQFAELGPRQRPPGGLPLRPRLVVQRLPGAHGRAPHGRPPRPAQGLDAGDERPRARPGDAGQGGDPPGPRGLPRQGRRQDPPARRRPGVQAAGRRQARRRTWESSSDRSARALLARGPGAALGPSRSGASGTRDRRAAGLQRFKMRAALQEFLAKEKALATRRGELAQRRHPGRGRRRLAGSPARPRPSPGW